MDIGGEDLRLVHRTRADKVDLRAAFCREDQVLAPNRDMTMFASGNDLTVTGGRIKGVLINLAGQQRQVPGLDQDIHRVGAAGLVLAQSTMAAVHDQRLPTQFKMNAPTGTTAFMSLAGHVSVSLQRVFRRGYQNVSPSVRTG